MAADTNFFSKGHRDTLLLELQIARNDAQRAQWAVDHGEDLLRAMDEMVCPDSIAPEACSCEKHQDSVNSVLGDLEVLLEDLLSARELLQPVVTTRVLQRINSAGVAVIIKKLHVLNKGLGEK